ncbi:MAG: RagB/SusD family nutrient uptake outer membrane protein [Fidelibacterota bacterium]
MKNRKLGVLMPALLGLLLVWGCTDLTEKPYGVVTPENFYQTEGELVAAVVPVYNGLKNASWGDYAHLQDISSDAMVVPTRGGDWDDGGIWRNLQEHDWQPSLGFLNGAWTGAYGGVARANSTLDALGRAEQTDLVKTFTAEVKVLRALYYWWLMDLFGGVPVVTDATTAEAFSFIAETDESDNIEPVDPDRPPAPNTRKEVFDFIVAQVKEALPDLEESHGAGNYGRITSGAANALLATVYLNAEVYAGEAMWEETIAACDEVINSGLYDLMPSFDDVFALENEGPSNTENILVFANRPEGEWDASWLRHMATLHYNQIPASPWNGFSVLADFYNSFDSVDARRDQILVGQQYVLAGPDEGDSAFDRDGNPLVFTVESPLVDATEGNGPRILKWPIDPDMSGWFGGNDYAIFRYSHILLAKAEAQFRLNGGGLALVNQVRERAGLDPLSTLNEDDIYWERGHEFLWEGFRRQDQIRFGTWEGAWTLHDATGDENLELFPIPQIQLDANPNLSQNPGYLGS